MRRLRFDVAYDGTEFHGWQVQPGLPTIQGTLQASIGEIEGAPVHVEASGRTDAGVHALAQVAAVTLDNPIPLLNFQRAVNRLLPPAIRVSHVRETRLDFHPRFHAVRKTYEYRIYREEICPPFVRRYVLHHPYPLDETAMAKAAMLYEGEHDFSAFAASDEDNVPGEVRLRRIFTSVLERQGAILSYRVCGSGFLKHMVRNMVGVLLGVGRGAWGLDSVPARLLSGSCIPPGPTALASGLFLVSVEYDD